MPVWLFVALSDQIAPCHRVWEGPLTGLELCLNKLEADRTMDVVGGEEVEVGELDVVANGEGPLLCQAVVGGK